MGFLRERPRVWSKVAYIWDCQQGTATLTVASLCDHVVAPPVDGEPALGDLEGEEDDDGSHGDTGGEGRCEHIVVLGPEFSVSWPSSGVRSARRIESS